jgi:hypothetical protein
MEIIIYTQTENSQCKKLQSDIMKTSDIQPIMAFDFKRLFNVLRNHLFGEVIIVFLISFEEELDFLISSKEQLFNSRHILILPNKEREFFSKSLPLYPRYIAYSNHDLNNVSLVLNKMVRNHMQYTKSLQIERSQHTAKNFN